MPANSFVIGFLLYAALLVGVLVIWLAAHRWQRGVWRREMGQRVEGFEVKPTDRSEK